MNTTQDTKQASRDERLRNLEILRYGHAVRINHTEDSFISADSSSPRLADDAILTGLCQLAAIRLDCSSAFICLNDLTRQHIIAEATRTISPYDVSMHAPSDELMFGVQSFDEAFGITHITLPFYTRGVQRSVNNAKTVINDRRSIFLDLKMEPLVANVPFLQGDHSPRFYVEIPLRNTAGVVVGIVSVLDDRPRSSFDEVDVRPLWDIARMTTDYLELMLLRSLNTHAHRLLQGLTQFNAGKSNIFQQDKDLPEQAPLSNMNKIKHDAGCSNSKKRRADTTRSRSTSPQSKLTLSTRSLSTSCDTPATSLDAEENIAPPIQAARNTTSPIGSCDPRTLANRTGQILANSTDQRRHKTNRVTTRIHSVFARAATLIREAMDLEVTCFFDMPASLHFTTRHREGRDDALRSARSSVDLSATADLDPTTARGSSDSDSQLNSSESNKDSNGEGCPDSVHCPCIATSCKQSSDFNELDSIVGLTGIAERSIKSLVSVYPTGHVFHFDALGLLSSSEDSEGGQEVLGLASKRRVITRLLSTSFPKARSLLFVPLYNDEHKLSSVFFGWIEDSFRVLTASDVVYVAGFANSIMCEVMRLEALAVERMKSTFVSSISHELRSPLHGILAAIELLRESKLNLEQTELTLMMESCGTTLLDIMNNLLEHAKINNTVEKDKHKKRRSKRAVKAHMKREPRQIPDPSLAFASLAEVVEETVSSAVSGHSVKTLRTDQNSDQPRVSSDTISNSEQYSTQATHLPTIILDIEKTDKWYMPIDTGAWRRIILNLVGNALKYTASGHVIIRLSLVETVRSDKTSRQILLAVSDTGRGMSETYMKGKLYSPFAQEDHLSVGVGLGLSIVHRLVTDLDGKIDINSEMNVGTNVRIMIPLLDLAKTENIPENFAPDIPDCALYSGKRHDSVCFYGFDNPSYKNTNTRALDLLKMEQSLSSIVTEWFGMDITSDPNEATLFIVEANYAYTLAERDIQNIVFSKKYVVIQSYGEAKFAGLHWPGCYSVMTTPVGPLKFTRALRTILQHRTERPVGALINPTPVSSQVTPIRHEAQSNSDPVASSESRPSHLHVPPGMERGRILLVDDNEINVRILANLVRKLNLSYSTASNGQEALDQYKVAYDEGQPFQYIFMDISMPVMDGLTSTRRIRAYEKERQKHNPARIFALTGLGHARMQEEAAASGIDQYFRKPVRLDTLRSVLKTPEIKSR